MAEEALSKALKYLGARMRSEYEVRRYLQTKGFASEDIEQAVSSLKEYNYLNDREYAGAFIRDRINFNPCGRKKIYAELRKRGVHPAVIEQALAENLCAETEAEMAVQAALKHRSDNKEKMLRYLLGRGFTYQAASCAWWELANGADKNDREQERF